MDDGLDDSDMQVDPIYSDEENELQSTKDALIQIQNAWLNEKFAPEILPNKMHLVESIIDQIDYFEEQLKRVNKQDLRYDIHTMELSRIRFILSSYIRIRLEKIEKFVHHILEQEEQRGESKYLTEKELQFAQEYATSVQLLFHTVVFQNIDQHVHSTIPKTKPNLNTHVVLKVNKTIRGVYLEDIDDEIDLEANSQHIMPYKSVAHLVKNDTVQLV